MSIRVVSLCACMLVLWGCSSDRGAGGGGSGATSGGSGGSAGGAGLGGTGGGGSGGTSGNGGSGGGSSGPIPMFPGAGTSDDAAPLTGGMVCDSVPGATLPTVSDVTRCFFSADDRTNPAATIEQVLECVDGATVVHLRLTFAPWFNDNTYGANSIGWSPRRGHRFNDLVGSDHAELVLMDGDGNVAMQFKMDYITADASAPSGYSALGVLGGDGSISIGDASDIVDWSTSLDRNLNDRGYGTYTTDSPATDESYTPNPATPEWDYRVVFDVWVDLDAFGDAGFAGAFIEYVHASPSKYSSDTIETTPDDCPPDWDPCMDGNPDTYCSDSTPPNPNDPCADGNPDTYCDNPVPPDPPTDPCADNQPDTYCADGSEPNNPEPSYCERYPTDPSCRPD